MSTHKQGQGGVGFSNQFSAITLPRYKLVYISGNFLRQQFVQSFLPEDAFRGESRKNTTTFICIKFV